MVVSIYRKPRHPRSGLFPENVTALMSSPLQRRGGSRPYSQLLRRQRPRHPRPRRARLLGPGLVLLPVRPARTILRWWRVRVGGGLLRLGQGRFKIRDPGRHALYQRRLRSADRLSSKVFQKARSVPFDILWRMRNSCSFRTPQTVALLLYGAEGCSRTMHSCGNSAVILLIYPAVRHSRQSGAVRGCHLFKRKDRGHE